jgi:hypothetical protein
VDRFSRTSFAGTDYADGRGVVRRVEIPGPPPDLGVRIEPAVETWMWYFAGWEPEFDAEGWALLAARARDRVPVLADPRVTFEGERYYRACHPDVVAWHIRWMREAGVTTMLFEFMSLVAEDGTMRTPYFTNRALELAFLGKTELGGPAVSAGPYADAMSFAIMWTNFPMIGPEFGRTSRDLAEYLVQQFLAQPNYRRLDDRPVVFLWSVVDLVASAGSTTAAAEFLELVRSTAEGHGLGRPMWIAVQGPEDLDLLTACGLDGATAYQYFGASGFTELSHLGSDGSAVPDRHEDFDSQTRPGYARRWDEMAAALSARGLEYLVPVMPMQDWQPIDRTWTPSVVIDGASPSGFAGMLEDARAAIERHGLRPIVVAEAWNEWAEGAFIEPSVRDGFAWLNAIRTAAAGVTA